MTPDETTEERVLSGPRSLRAKAQAGSIPSGHRPAFFLSEPPGDGPVLLADGELEHGLRVLRLGVGDLALGLDGLGGRWPLRVEAAGRRQLDLVPTGPRESEPLPGEPGAALPWIEIAVAWPRKQRADGMLGRLVQLGVSSITPLEAHRRGGSNLGDTISPRWQRILREHAKQCGRLWLPTIRPPSTCARLKPRLGDAAAALLDPSAGLGLSSWTHSLPLGPSLLGTRARPIVLIVGPEGGFDQEERGVLLEAGATPVQLNPHILRIETAAEAALAVVAALLS